MMSSFNMVGIELLRDSPTERASEQPIINLMQVLLIEK